MASPNEYLLHERLLAIERAARAYVTDGGKANYLALTNALDALDRTRARIAAATGTSAS